MMDYVISNVNYLVFRAFEIYFKEKRYIQFTINNVIMEMLQNPRI